MRDEDFRSIETNDYVLRHLDENGVIDLARPLWLNLNHHDNREYLPEKKFGYYIEPTSTLDDISHIFVPSSNERAIPVTNIKLPYVMGNDSFYLNFLASARPASPKELVFDDGFVSTKKESKIPSVSELEQMLKAFPKRSMFQPHLQGLWAWVEKDTIFYYPFGQKINGGVSLEEVAQAGLQEEEIDYISVRNPQISLASRFNRALPLLLERGVLSPTKNYFKNSYKDAELALNNTRLDGARSRKTILPNAKNILYKDISRESLKDNTPFVSYFPLVKDDFGEDIFTDDGEPVMDAGETQTFPVALATRFDGEPGLFNYGIFKSFGVSKSRSKDGRSKTTDDVLEVLYWNKASYAKKISAQISSALNMPVQTIYYEPAKGASSLHVLK